MSFSCFLASPRENLETNFIMVSREPPVICDVSVYLKSAPAGALEAKSKNEASEARMIFMALPLWFRRDFQLAHFWCIVLLPCTLHNEFRSQSRLQRDRRSPYGLSLHV